MTTLYEQHKQLVILCQDLVQELRVSKTRTDRHQSIKNLMKIAFSVAKLCQTLKVPMATLDPPIVAFFREISHVHHEYVDSNLDSKPHIQFDPTFLNTYFLDIPAVPESAPSSNPAAPNPTDPRPDTEYDWGKSRETTGEDDEEEQEQVFGDDEYEDRDGYEREDSDGEEGKQNTSRKRGTETFSPEQKKRKKSKVRLQDTANTPLSDEDDETPGDGAIVPETKGGKRQGRKKSAPRQVIPPSPNRGWGTSSHRCALCVKQDQEICWRHPEILPCFRCKRRHQKCHFPPESYYIPPSPSPEASQEVESPPQSDNEQVPETRRRSQRQRKQADTASTSFATKPKSGAPPKGDILAPSSAGPWTAIFALDGLKAGSALDMSQFALKSSVQQLSEAFADLQSDVYSLRGTIQGDDADNIALHNEVATRIDELEATIAQSKEQRKALSNDFRKMRSAVDDVLSHLDKLKLDDLGDDLAGVKAKVEELGEKVREVPDQIPDIESLEADLKELRAKIQQEDIADIRLSVNQTQQSIQELQTTIRRLEEKVKSPDTLNSLSSTVLNALKKDDGFIAFVSDIRDATEATRVQPAVAEVMDREFAARIGNIDKNIEQIHKVLQDQLAAFILQELSRRSSELIRAAVERTMEMFITMSRIPELPPPPPPLPSVISPSLIQGALVGNELPRLSTRGDHSASTVMQAGPSAIWGSVLTSLPSWSSRASSASSGLLEGDASGLEGDG